MHMINLLDESMHGEKIKSRSTKPDLIEIELIQLHIFEIVLLLLDLKVNRPFGMSHLINKYKLIILLKLYKRISI